MRVKYVNRAPRTHDHTAELGNGVRAGRRAPAVGHRLPQAAFVRLAGQGLLSGRLLDAGCGTGEHALLAAARGARAADVDISPQAIAAARDKAAARDCRPASGSPTC